MQNVVTSGRLGARVSVAGGVVALNGKRASEHSRWHNVAVLEDLAELKVVKVPVLVVRRRFQHRVNLLWRHLPVSHRRENLLELVLPNHPRVISVEALERVSNDLFGIGSCTFFVRRGAAGGCTIRLAQDSIKKHPNRKRSKMSMALDGTVLTENISHTIICITRKRTYTQLLST